MCTSWSCLPVTLIAYRAPGTYKLYIELELELSTKCGRSGEIANRILLIESVKTQLKDGVVYVYMATCAAAVMRFVWRCTRNTIRTGVCIRQSCWQQLCLREPCLPSWDGKNRQRKRQEECRAAQEEKRWPRYSVERSIACIWVS